ncbi:helix-turn-helix domain-containing protein [Bradyrhizobium liaoningense]|uniref:helix-turn-helix domain-containing protein n=1 Tax=Bradyrhizobium liaoningense TaxID=43992 RepID=UPI001BA6B317|nr:helix-turn-helix domain-containing protein [Bradyrhizobium liaoningense]MBR0838917.1 helix-turn-helix domain-containing protein [Bradyrhizobium liaoningense]
MPHNPAHSISAMHRRFTSPDEWRSTIEPRFRGSFYTPRHNSFSIHARLEKLARVQLLDLQVGRSGLGDLHSAKYGYSIEGIETHPYFIIWQQAGAAWIRQAGLDTELIGGEWALFDARVPTSFLLPDRTWTIGLMIPQAHCDWQARIGPGGVNLRQSPEGRIASAGLREALRGDDWIKPQSQRSFEAFLLDAVQASLPVAAASDHTPPARLAAKLDQARQFIEAGLTDPDLGPDHVGDAIGMSRRSLYRMFDLLGKTPMEYIYEVRLAEAARQLRGKLTDRPSVTAIAHAVGFVDSSHFSRMFRARYGVSPSQWAVSLR